MAGIDQLLTQILNTKLGKDMRQAIHDSIAQCYDDVTSPELNVKAFEQAVQNKIDSSELATMIIPDGSITVEKLDSNLSYNIDDIADLKSALPDKLDTNQGGGGREQGKVYGGRRCHDRNPSRGFEGFRCEPEPYQDRSICASYFKAS